MVLALSTVADARDDSARVLLRRLVAARVAAPQAAMASGTTIACVALTARESHARGAHVFACASSAGEILGAVLSPKGQVRCSVNGAIDPLSSCGTLSICGVLRDVCV
jgi:hypothetical protein